MKTSTAFGLSAAVLVAAAVAYVLLKEQSEKKTVDKVLQNSQTLDKTYGVESAEMSTLNPDRLLIRQKNIFTGAITTRSVDVSDMNWFERLRLKTISPYTLF